MSTNKNSLSDKSRSIPIHQEQWSFTQSDTRARESEEFADFRDYVMFCRIAYRMAMQTEKIRDSQLRRENEKCLAHIIGIRNGSEDDDSVYSPVPSFYGSNEATQASRDEDIFVLDL